MKRLPLVVAGSGTAMVIVVLVVLSGHGLLKEKQGAEAQTTSRPNIVFVMTDDLDEHSMEQLGGIQQVMGSNGTTFKNAYVTYPLCCPSRATILRGQYPHNHGIVGNVPPLDGEAKFRNSGFDQSTVATWLNDAGYQTKYIGKYMNGYNDLYKPPGWDEWFVLQGDESKNQVNDDGRSITLTGHSTDAFANEATDFIRRSSANAAPFFVTVGTKAPHRPPEVADRHLSSFVDTPLPRPPNFDEPDVSDKARWLQSYPPLTQAQIDYAQTLYRERLRSMLSVEDLLEQTIATLQETGELGNTYIFFTSDNGFHLGEHRLPRGKRTSYEEDISVPLMVRGPGVPAGITRQQLVINNDFAPTIANLAGVTPPGFVDGSSFVPLLSASPPSSWRMAFLEEGTLETIDTDTPTPTHKGVHTREHMFVEYAETAEQELYDLSADPYQLQSKPRTGNEQLYSTLESRLNALRACSGDACRSAEWGTTPPHRPPPPTSPRVTITSPAANTTGVAPSANLTATFSEAMMSSTINGNNLQALRSRKGAPAVPMLACSVSYDGPRRLRSTRTHTTLRLGTTYKAVVSTGAKDVAGNQLDQDQLHNGLEQKTWLFTVSN